MKKVAVDIESNDPVSTKANDVVGGEGQSAAAATGENEMKPVEDSAFAMIDPTQPVGASHATGDFAETNTNSAIPMLQRPQSAQSVGTPANEDAASKPTRVAGPRIVTTPSAKESDGSLNATAKTAAGGERRKASSPDSESAPAISATTAPVAHPSAASSDTRSGRDLSEKASGATTVLSVDGKPAHSGSASAVASDAKSADSLRAASPQMEIGILDPSLGEVRVQAMLDRSGAIHIDVAGRSQAADAVLDQIAPLMHAAALQQAETHGHLSTIHVTAASSVAESGAGGIGSLTGSGMGGVAQSGSFSASLSNDGQSQSQSQRRRDHVVAYASQDADATATDTKAALPAASFFAQPKGSHGVSVRI